MYGGRVNMWPVICGFMEAIIMNGGRVNMWPVICGLMEATIMNAECMEVE
jgi:hypothetical protein